MNDAGAACHTEISCLIKFVKLAVITLSIEPHELYVRVREEVPKRVGQPTKISNK